jgi:hypothetical protein
MLQCYVLTCGRSVTAFSAHPRSQRPGQGPRSPYTKASPAYIILEINSGNMFRPCGGSSSGLYNVMKLLDIKQYIVRRDPEWFTYVYELRVTDVIYLVACMEMFLVWFTASLHGGR